MTAQNCKLRCLMPDGPAWSGQNTEALLDVIDAEHDRCIDYAAGVHDDFNPFTTTMLDEWERTFSLPGGSFLSDAQRRTRLAGRWSMLSTGTMSKISMERIFSESGFDVIVRTLAADEDPRPWFTSAGPSAFNRVGARFNATGVRFGNSGIGNRPYLLVNKTQYRVDTVYDNFYGSGDYGYQQYGKILSQTITPVEYNLPDASSLWGCLFVIESPTGTFAEIPYNRLNDFFELAYMIKPLHMWAIARVKGV